MIKQAIRLYGRTILAGVLGIVMYVSVGVLVSVAVPRGEPLSATATFLMNLIALVLQGSIYFLIIYAGMWSLGDKEANAVQFGHMQATAARGFHIGCVAAIPSVLTFLVLVADKVFSFWPLSAAIYRLCHTALYPILAWSMGSVVSVTTADLAWWQLLCAGIPVLFLPLAAGISYYFGFKHILVSDRLMFVSKKKKQ